MRRIVGWGGASARHMRRRELEALLESYLAVALLNWDGNPVRSIEEP